jgi:hypothetical protein
MSDIFEEDELPDRDFRKSDSDMSSQYNELSQKYLENLFKHIPGKVIEAVLQSVKYHLWPARDKLKDLKLEKGKWILNKKEFKNENSKRNENSIEAWLDAEFQREYNAIIAEEIAESKKLTEKEEIKAYVEGEKNKGRTPVKCVHCKEDFFSGEVYYLFISLFIY